MMRYIMSPMDMAVFFAGCMLISFAIMSYIVWMIDRRERGKRKKGNIRKRK